MFTHNRSVQDFIDALNRNGWMMVNYNGKLRSAPRGLSHIFRDLKAGNYLISTNDDFLLNPKGEIIVFPEKLSPADYEVAWFSLVMMEAIKSGWVFVEKTGWFSNEWVFTPELYQPLPAGAMVKISAGDNGFYMCHITEGLFKTTPAPYIQSLLLDTSYGTKWELRQTELLYTMSTQELQLLVEDIQEKLNLLAYNVRQLK